MSELNEVFAKEIAKINKKIAEATAALAEANHIADKIGQVLHVHPYCYESGECTEEELEQMESFSSAISFSALMSELDNAGWATSALYC